MLHILLQIFQLIAMIKSVKCDKYDCDTFNKIINIKFVNKI